MKDEAILLDACRSARRCQSTSRSVPPFPPQIQNRADPSKISSAVYKVLCLQSDVDRRSNENQGGGGGQDLRGETLSNCSGSLAPSERRNSPAGRKHARGICDDGADPRVKCSTAVGRLDC
jgi:hypothetical protein